VDAQEVLQLRESLRSAQAEIALYKEREAEYEESNRLLQEENWRLNSSLKTITDERHHLMEEVETLQLQLDQETEQLRMQLDQETRYHKQTQERAKQALQQANERQRYAEEKLRSYQEERASRPTVCELQNWQMVGGIPQASSPRSNSSPRREHAIGSQNSSCKRSPALLHGQRQSGTSSPSALPPPGPHATPLHQKFSPLRTRDGTPSSACGSRIGGRSPSGWLNHGRSTQELESSSSHNSGPREVPLQGCVAEKVCVFEMRCQTPRRGYSGNPGSDSARKAGTMRTDNLDVRGQDHRLRTPPVMPRVGSSPSIASTIAMPTVPLASTPGGGARPLVVPCNLGSVGSMGDTPEVAEEDHSREVFNMSPMRKGHYGMQGTATTQTKKNLFQVDDADYQDHRRESKAPQGSVQMLVRQFGKVR